MIFEWKHLMIGAATAALLTAGGVDTLFAKEAAGADSTLKLEGGEAGTTLKSLTIQGEDRVRIEFERPLLSLTPDASSAPGLEWDNVWSIIRRDLIDSVSPLVAGSAFQNTQFRPRPWFQEFRTGGVATFQPVLKNVARWSLIVANSRGETVITFSGKGNPPKEIVWDGRSTDGTPVAPGLTYSYVLEAYDEAGNKRNFMGDGFELPSYAIETDKETIMIFSADRLMSSRSESGAADPEILLEATTRINQIGRAETPVWIHVSARSFNQARSIADDVVRVMRPLVLGDPARIQAVTEVDPTAPENGSVAIRIEK